MKTLKTVCWVIVVLLAIAGVAGVVIHFTSESSSSSINSTDSLVVRQEDRNVSKVDYIVLRDSVAFSVSTADYKVKVVPKSGVDFRFQLDGEEKRFKDLSNLNMGFDIAIDGTSFSIAPKGTVEEILAAVFPLYEVSILDDPGVSKPQFTLIVSSGSSSVEVDLLVDLVKLKLSRSEVVF